ncbi:GatB/YqeY domain-containing protein [Patescibacteria group bacterium]
MSLKDKLQEDMISALKEKKEVEGSVLKMLKSAVINTEIKENKKDDGLSDEEILKIIKSEVKKRNDAISAFTKGGRDELAQKEKKELIILKAYLPKELPDEEIEKIVNAVVTETKASSMTDFGNVMKEAMAKLQGQADGKKVSEMVKKLLND